VEKGRLPLYQALKIAQEDDTAVQIALAEAHESGALSGKKLVAVQKSFPGASITVKGFQLRSVIRLRFPQRI